MNRQLPSKIIAAGILAIIMGCFLHIVEQKKHSRWGERLFLRKEAARYDKRF